MTDRNTDVGGIPIEEVVIEAKEALRDRSPARRGETSWTRLWDHLRREWQIYLMLLPTIIWFIVFLYKPMYGLQIAFKDYSIFRGVAGSPWVGWEHFETLFSNDQFLRAVKNTITISFYNLLFGFPAPIILALMFNEVLHATYKRTAQTIVYLPHFISSVIISGIVITAFSPTAGIVNTVLDWLGFDAVYFLTQPEWFRPIFVGTGIWQEAGFGSIVFLAAIAGVNPSLYESAVVDGANRWQMMWRITVPSILPTILIMLIIRIGNIMEVSFELVILLYQPATYETADVVNTWVYRQGLQSGQYDLAAAAGLFNAVVAFVLVMTANTLSRRFSRTSLW
ncbi:ABC transporter permease [Poseidonocella sedimentorum]|uniref:Carbohydrate ABC transporter membrane protein 1, CUT1 family n=1 Tax=Poseidonocella sedimentorum TaxID=871652 RepID=A0A1I6EAF6_9RHOB|nr:sugar ABC transporter permease [Poseidonocella sedimentorum]SFR14716.1 carbohydrate ABC transporter membrane protein 1, CUT1 family [Poseidonocella sedimentorum]